jgi:hypothetical protein
MTDDLFKFRETTSNTLSSHDVGIADIYERDLLDEKGVSAPRISAVVVVHDPKTDAIQRHTVFAGNVVSIGSDRYCVESVEPGKSSPGWVSFRRLK